MTCLKILRYGQNFFVYPGAFEPEVVRSTSVQWFDLCSTRLSCNTEEGISDLPKELIYEELLIETKDSVTLRCYFLPAGQPWCSRRSRVSQTSTLAFSIEWLRQWLQLYTKTDARATVIMFHGNGYHVWHHLYAAQYFVELGCNVLLLSYRGYVYPSLQSYIHWLNSSEQIRQLEWETVRKRHMEWLYLLCRSNIYMKGLRKDAQAILDYVLGHEELSKGKIVRLSFA